MKKIILFFKLVEKLLYYSYYWHNRSESVKLHDKNSTLFGLVKILGAKKTFMK